MTSSVSKFALGTVLALSCFAIGCANNGKMRAPGASIAAPTTAPVASRAEPIQQSPPLVAESPETQPAVVTIAPEPATQTAVESRPRVESPATTQAVDASILASTAIHGTPVEPTVPANPVIAPPVGNDPATVLPPATANRGGQNTESARPMHSIIEPSVQILGAGSTLSPAIAAATENSPQWTGFGFFLVLLVLMFGALYVWIIYGSKERTSA